MQQPVGSLDVVHIFKSKTALFSCQWIMYKILFCRKTKR